ncbi:fluoride exporter [Entomortierella parvispora]|uniref:Fluoride exporter n=1 Tax=Entomortierella parvispora TaxID=205924 RepID=A0A9P3LTB5_9FUNG|nr:fluoride exporter [Entomortierella parvispora]
MHSPSTPANDEIIGTLPSHNGTLSKESIIAEPSKSRSHGLYISRKFNVLQPAIIIPFAILGLLIRLGLNSIQTFAGQQVFALVWPQFVGCMIMGALVATRDWIEKGFGLLDYKDKAKGHWLGPYFYVALSSGLCGSITTFSSWSVGTFVELINPARINRHPLQNILSALSEIAVTIAMSLVGLKFGKHLGQSLIKIVDDRMTPGEGPSFSEENLAAVLAEEDTNVMPGSTELAPSEVFTQMESPTDSSTQTETETQTSTQIQTYAQMQTPAQRSTAQSAAPKQEIIHIPSAPTLWTLHDWLFIVAGGALWLGVIFAAIWMPSASFRSWRHVAFACCFAPLGANLRWYMSRWNASSLRRFQFPLGTFAANILGSVILGAVVCMQHSVAIRGHSGAATACQVFGGLQDGLCGCLTTISTFTLELKTLPRKASYIYGITSVVVAQLVLLVILGSFVWTQSSIKDEQNGYLLSTCSM